jgi:hypothetical protein
MPTRGTGRLRALIPLILDLAVPTAGYYALHLAGLSDAWALTIAGLATGVLALVNTLRRGRLDAVGLLVVAEIALVVTLTLTTSDARIILLRPAFYLAVGGAVCLVSCVSGRPLMYTAATPIATKGDPARVVAYDAAWHRSAELRRIHRQLTAFVGAAMLGYAAVRVLFTYTLPVSSAVIAQEIPGLVLIAVVLLAIRLRVPRLRRIVDGVQADLAGPGQPGPASGAIGATPDRTAQG